MSNRMLGICVCRLEGGEVLLQIPGEGERRSLKGLARGALQDRDRDYQTLQYYKYGLVLVITFVMFAVRYVIGLNLTCMQRCV